MCGIVGYIGEKDCTNVLIDALSKLEYRGYDSAGIAVFENGEIKVEKAKGRLENLVNKMKENGKPVGHCGIGHTRWATHGEPSDINSHPHGNKRVSIVHNGIIENYKQIKDFLISKGYEFESQTDTETVAKLLDFYYDGNPYETIKKVLSEIEGSYALGIIFKDFPETIFAVRKDSPLIVGLGKDESFIASDIPAVLNHTRDVYLLEDKEFAILTPNGVELRNEDGEKIEKEIYHVTWNIDAAEKGGFEDFMLKEIHEQPRAVKDTLASKIALGKEILIDNISFTKEQLENFDRIYIVACGTAYHAGLVGKTVIEKFAKIPVEIDIASEFRYREPMVTNKTLIIVVSQSGETADTLAVLRDSKKQGARVLAITNVVGSSVSREADDVFYTLAGPEIAVASTKAYVTQLAAFYILGLYFASLKETMTNEEIETIKAELLQIPNKIDKVLKMKDSLQKFASTHYNHKDMYFLGRGLDYAVAMEGSLKLKEISYIHCDAYAGGELKHGPIALIEKNTAVITLLTQESLKDKMISNVREVSTRGGNIFAVVNEGDTTTKEVVDDLVYIPKTIDILTPLISVVPLQLISYYVAKQKGCDVDKPRNLAKSVTVE